MITFIILNVFLNLPAFKSGAPQTVQIISAPGTVSGSGGVTPARLSGPGGQPVTLLQGPRTAGGQLQRVVIRPHTIASVSILFSLLNYL